MTASRVNNGGVPLTDLIWSVPFVWYPMQQLLVSSSFPSAHQHILYFYHTLASAPRLYWIDNRCAAVDLFFSSKIDDYSLVPQIVDLHCAYGAPSLFNYGANERHGSYQDMMRHLRQNSRF